MKASEVLSRYAAGERNFQGVNLRGQSFKGKNLSGADFSKADLRSTNFTRANLKGVNFAGARCGLQKRWVTFLTIYSCLLASLSGFCSIFAASLVLLIFDSSLENQIAGWISLFIILIFLILTIRQEIIVGALAAAMGMGIVIVIAITVAKTAAVTVAIAVVGTIAVSMGLALALAIASAVAIAIEGIISVAILVITVTVVGALASALEGVLAAAIAIIVAGTGVYVGWRSIKISKKDTWLRSFAIDFASIGGTSFRGANLTDANFTGAKLQSTNFRTANLTHVRWYGAKMLDFICPGDTYLKSTQVRQLLIGRAKNINFDRQDLRGINIQGANLADASFIGTDLSEANLQDTDLSRAKLVQTLLDKTDFTGANLTGAFIQDWGITSNTNLQGVKCKYVFMRLPTEENPDPYRKPDNRSEVFEDGDFANFIRPIFDTLDLYHNQGVDPRAIAISFKELAEKHPDAELEIVSIERKGRDKFLLRAKTNSDVNRSQLTSEYFDAYYQYKALIEESYKDLLSEKDNRIQQLENMVVTSLKRPGFYAENYSINVEGNIKNIENVNNIKNINIEGNIEKIENYQEIENTIVKGNIEGIKAFMGDYNTLNISGDTVIGQINSGLIEGEIENIENVQTAELIESNRKDLGIEIIKGSGMLVSQSNELVLRVTNTSNKFLNSTLIELQDSGEYEIQGDNSITLSEIEIQESIDISFKLLMKVAKEIAVNYKINNILQEQPIYIFAVADNPYIYGSPVEGEVFFFGRNKEFDDIIQAVTKPTKQDILIIGERRTGKTSLLNQINKSFKSPLIPVYIVLNTSKSSTAEGILDLILEQVVNNLYRRNILNKSKIKSGDFKSLDFIENIKYVIEVARNNLPDIRVVLLIDEADYILQIKQNSSNTIDERPQNFLRAVLQSEIGTYLRAVVAGTTELSTYMSQRSSPFFNHFRFLRLKPFSTNETRDLIIKPADRLGYQYTEKAIQQIINLSGGQPYYCQAICYESFNNALESKRQEITEDDVSVAKKKIIEDLFNGYESGFWQRFNETEKQFVMSLTKNRTKKRIDESEMKRLLDWNIIIVEESSGNYQFSSELIRQWTIMASN